MNTNSGYLMNVVMLASLVTSAARCVKDAELWLDVGNYRAQI